MRQSFFRGCQKGGYGQQSLQLERLEHRTLLAADLFDQVVVLDEADVNTPTNAAVADLNGDQIADLVVVGAYERHVLWYPGLGDNSFSEPRIIATVDGAARKIDVADLDGDRDQDVIVVAGNTTVWYQNRGRGGEFAPMASLDHLREFATGDVDLDGDIDIVGAFSFGSLNGLLLFENNGLGDFQRTDLASAAGFVDHVDIVDLDGNGQPNVVFVEADHTNGGSSVMWMKSRGGEFVIQPPVLRSATTIIAVNLSDLDRDEDLDLVTLQFDGRYAIHTHEHVDGGVFSAANTVLSVNETIRDNKRLGLIGSADIDGDSNVDIVMTSFDEDEGAIAWLPSSGSTKDFGPQRTILAIPDRPTGPSRVTLSDLDSDLDADLIALHGQVDRVTSIENLGGGDFSSPYEIADVGIPHITSHVAVDLDDDTDLDIAILVTDLENEGSIHWYENEDGRGTFLPLKTLAAIDPAYRQLRAVDVDADDDADLLLAGTRNAWLERTPDGSFKRHPLTGTEFGLVSYGLIPIDVDGDGDTDLADLNAKSVGWYEQISSGHFSTRRRIAIGGHFNVTYLNNFAVGDFDNDGDGDFVTTIKRGSSDRVTWVENQGTAFISHDIADVDDPEDVLVADLNGDALLDIVYYAEEDEATRFQLNISDDNANRFGPPRTLQDDRELNGVSLSDLDGDGDVDFVGTRSSEVHWFENRIENGEAFNESPEVVAVDGLWVDGSFADLDRDGDLDFVAVSVLDGRVAWYPNKLVPFDGDFDRDGIVDSSDIGHLQKAIRANSNSPWFDVNGDGTLDRDDLTEYLAAYLGTVNGDVNLDRSVDAIDFQIIRDNLFQVLEDSTDGWRAGDLNGDGLVDSSDLNIWLINRFVSPAAADAPSQRVPQAPLAVPTVIASSTHKRTSIHHSCDEPPMIPSTADAVSLRFPEVSVAWKASRTVRRHRPESILIPQMQTDKVFAQLSDMAGHSLEAPHWMKFR